MGFYLRNANYIGSLVDGTTGVYDFTSLRLNPSFSAITFTNAGKTGATGPSLEQCLSAYASFPPITPSTFFVNNGYQSFVIPITGTYRFTLKGASGGIFTASPPTSIGAPTIDGYKRAPGALVVGTYALTAGQVITFVIGQGGADEPSYNNPGGGGGTYVTLGTYSDVVSSTDTLLFVAGGGGGGGLPGTTDNFSSGQGQATDAGANGETGTQGTFGNGGSIQTAGNSTSGGGYFTNAGGATTNYFGASPPDGASAGFRRGSVGSKNSSTAVGEGGFGGGGSGSSQLSTDNDKGGGGGYSGGGYGFDSVVYGGGGGSFSNASATNVTKTTGGNTTDRHGSLLLELL